eukprot:337855_1
MKRDTNILLVLISFITLTLAAFDCSTRDRLYRETRAEYRARLKACADHPLFSTTPILPECNCNDQYNSAFMYFMQVIYQLNIQIILLNLIQNYHVHMVSMYIVING